MHGLWSAVLGTSCSHLLVEPVFPLQSIRTHCSTKMAKQPNKDQKLATPPKVIQNVQADSKPATCAPSLQVAPVNPLYAAQGAGGRGSARTN